MLSLAKDANFIMMFNNMFHKLSNDERYMYAWLYRYRHYIHNEWMTVINIDFIASMLKARSIKLSGSERLLRDSIRNILIVLEKEKFIGIESDSDISSTPFDKILTIYFFDNQEYHSGFEKLRYDLFDRFGDTLEFSIYNYINRYSSYGVSIPDSQWQDVLGVSKTKVRVTIEKMNNDKYNPRIWKFSGSYITGGKVKQEENQYYTNPKQDVIEKWKKWYDESNVKVTDGFVPSSMSKINSKINKQLKHTNSPHSLFE